MSAPDPSPVLGVSLTPHTIEAVLLRAVEAHPVIVRRFARPRPRVGEPSLASDYASTLPGLKGTEDADVTLQVGASAVSDDLPFDATLDPLGTDGRDSISGDGAGASNGGPRLFAAPLREILAECKEIGCPNPDVVFVAGPPDVAHVELAGNLADTTSNGWRETVKRYVPFGRSTPGGPRMAALRSVYKGGFDARRVRFLPMTPAASGTARHLALVPTHRDSVTPTVQTGFGPNRDVTLSARRMDAEVAIHVDVVRRYLAPESDHTTAVIRVGAEDTLILFMRGSALRHVEHPRSVTSYDAPDTIASRVLLYQDEQQIERVDAVVLIGGPRDERLVSSFREYYPDAAVGRLHELLLKENVGAAEDVLHTLTPESGPALAAALRVLDEPLEDGDLNLLDRSAQQTARPLPFFAWHTVAMLLVIVASTLFFVWRYVGQQTEIAQLQTRIQANPVALPNLSPADLQQRVDSLNAVHAQYARSLEVLDSLLLGSTEWSTTIARTARQTDAIEGIWFEEWSLSPDQITLRGNAMDRNRVATLARNLDGVVHEVMYADIDGARVYPFEITIPRDISMPDAALALRERNLDAEAARSITGEAILDADLETAPNAP